MRRLYYNDDEFSKVFSDKLKDHRVSVPAGNWSAIRSKLNKSEVRRYALLKWAGSVIATLFILGSLIVYSTHDTQKSHLAQREELIRQEAYTASSNSVIPAPKSEDYQYTPDTQSVYLSPKSLDEPSVSKPKVEQVMQDINNAISSIKNVSNSPSASAVIAGSREDVSISGIKNVSNSSHALAASSGNREDVSMEEIQVVKEYQIPLEDIVPGTLPTRDDPEDLITTPLEVNANNIPSVSMSSDENTAIKRPVIVRDCSNSGLKLYGGLAVNAQNTYLLSSTVIDNPNLHYKFSPGYSYGVQVGYNILPKLSVEIGGIISHENQNYSSADYPSKIPNLYVPLAQNEWIKLDYIRIPVLARYKFATSPSKCICDESLNIVGGLQYGRFDGGTTYNGTTTYTLNNSYVKQNDLQFVVGVEREKAISKHIVFNLGLRCAYSSSQIASTDALRINELYKPHNFNSAITLSLNYR